MRAVLHPVPGERVVHRRRDALAREADVDCDRARALEEPIEMRLKADQPAVDEAEPFPDAVAQDKPLSKTETRASLRGTNSRFT
jgi:hypothetical protein